MFWPVITYKSAIQLRCLSHSQSGMHFNAIKISKYTNYQKQNNFIVSSDYKYFWETPTREIHQKDTIMVDNDFNFHNTKCDRYNKSMLETEPNQR